MPFQRFRIFPLPIVIPLKLRRRIYDTLKISYQLKYSVSLMCSVAVCRPDAIINLKFTKEHAIITLFYG